MEKSMLGISKENIYDILGVPAYNLNSVFIYIQGDGILLVVFSLCREGDILKEKTIGYVIGKPGAVSDVYGSIQIASAEEIKQIPSGTSLTELAGKYTVIDTGSTFYRPIIIGDSMSLWTVTLDEDNNVVELTEHRISELK